MGASLAVTRALLVYRFPLRPSVVLMKCQDYTYIQKKKILTVYSRGHQCGGSDLFIAELIQNFYLHLLHEVKI